MFERRHAGPGVHLLGIMYVIFDPAVAFDIGNRREVGRQAAASTLKRMALAAAYREKELFSIVRYGTPVQ